jgi:hypothetical protein
MEREMKSSRISILVVDDVPSVSSSWKAKLQKALPGNLAPGVESLGIEQLADELQILESRRTTARLSPDSEIPGKPCRMDACDVLLVDFDLIEGSSQSGRVPADITGETVAYLSRCYSGCGYIIALNRRYRDNTFDLTLRGVPDSFADLDLPEMSIDSPALWTGSTGENSFNPWYWPNLLIEAENLERCVAALDAATQSPALQLAGLDEDDFKLLRIDVIERLVGIGAKVKSPRDILQLTPGQIAVGAVKSRQRKDEVLSAYAARIGAARMRKWLQWEVLPGQDPISDLPHVIARIQGLANSFSAESLNKIPYRDAEEAMHVFKPAMGVSRFLLPPSARIWWPCPVLNWRKLIEAPETVEAQMSSSARENLVFCEDVSCFLPQAFSRPFRAEVASAYDLRYVCDPSRLTAVQKRAFADVSYEPAMRFSM